MARSASTRMTALSQRGPSAPPGRPSCSCSGSTSSSLNQRAGPWSTSSTNATHMRMATGVHSACQRLHPVERGHSHRHGGRADLRRHQRDDRRLADPRVHNARRRVHRRRRPRPAGTDCRRGQRPLHRRDHIRARYSPSPRTTARRSRSTFRLLRQGRATA